MRVLRILCRCSLTLSLLLLLLGSLLTQLPGLLVVRKSTFRHLPPLTFQQYQTRALLQATSSGFVGGAESNKVLPGSMIEHSSLKGSRLVALVVNRSAGQVEVMNDAKKMYMVPLGRVTFHIANTYAFGDLIRLNDQIQEMKPQTVESLWEKFYSAKRQDSIALRDVAQYAFKLTTPVELFLAYRLMSQYGGLFFNCSISGQTSTFTPLTPISVQENLKNRAALNEFKQWYTKSKSAVAIPNMKSGRRPAFPSLSAAFAGEEIPERITSVLRGYEEGLKQLLYRSHPLNHQGLARIVYNPTAIVKAEELLTFLGLAPSPKNARKILELLGMISPHENIEKRVMSIRDTFPKDVLDDALQMLQDASIGVPDPDERLRRDLRYLRAYAIDREGAGEIDDALSIEILENGQEKLWIHIADVSRWIRPGSRLSVEAEMRMLSVYMPDEKISLFPERLSTELLSLGAKAESYALSCGVVLNDVGEIVSYEVCASKIRLTRKISYTQLDDILNKNISDISSSSFSRSKLIKPTVLTTPGDPFSAAGPLWLGGIQSDTAIKEKTVVFNDEMITRDLRRLNHWALIRHQHRIRCGALDEYLRHKTDLSLSVKRDTKNPQKYSVFGYMTWSNTSSVCLVSEFMILMSQTIAKFCVDRRIPVWYKVQDTGADLSPVDYLLKVGEVPFTRAIRILKQMRPANDSKTPGRHCTSGSDEYVQCTSPIRRYHDLYNHFRLKAALHEASLSETWADLAAEEAGITKLDNMASADERFRTLTAIRIVTRNREHYWLSMYIDKLVAASTVFNCVVYTQDKSSESPSTGHFYEVFVLQLGSTMQYRMFSFDELLPGTMVKGKMYRIQNNIKTSPHSAFLVVPAEVDKSALPEAILNSINYRNSGDKKEYIASSDLPNRSQSFFNDEDATEDDIVSRDRSGDVIVGTKRIEIATKSITTGEDVVDDTENENGMEENDFKITGANEGVISVTEDDV